MKRNLPPKTHFLHLLTPSLEGVHKLLSQKLSLYNRPGEPKIKFGAFCRDWFRSGINTLDLFGYNKEEIKYYQTRTPSYWSLRSFWNEKGAVLQIDSYQNITRQWNIALNMLRLRAKGFTSGKTVQTTIFLSPQITTQKITAIHFWQMAL